MDTESIAHPKSTQENVQEAFHLNDLLLKGFSGDKDSFNAAQQELAHMTPVERRAIAETLAKFSDDLKATPGMRSSLGHSMPYASFKADANGDVSSITFTDNDEHKGTEKTLDLADRNKSDGPNTQRYELPNGEMRVATFDADKKLTEVQDSDGDTITRNSDGTYTRMDRDNSVMQLSNVQVKSDGSLTFSVPGHENGLNVAETTSANGDRTSLVETTNKDNSKSDVSLVTHKDGTTSQIGEEGRMDISNNGNHLVIHPVSGGSVTYDVQSMEPFKCAMTVEFPDGAKKSWDDVTQGEFQKIKDEPIVPKVNWKPDHHLDVLTHESP